MKTNHDAGFSLLEILIVVSILGILISILVPRFVNALTVTNNTAAQAYAHNVALWVASAESGNGTVARGSYAGSCISNELQKEGAADTLPGAVASCLVAFAGNRYTVTVTSVTGTGGPAGNGIFTEVY